MNLVLLPLFAIAAAAPAGPCGRVDCDVVAADPASPDSARIAQVQLAQLLADADSIDSITSDGHTIAFAIDVVGEGFVIDATTAANGSVIAIVLRDRGRGAAERGELSWLAHDLVDAVAITKLSTTASGEVTLATTDGRTYLAIPIKQLGADLGGNGPTEARWAAAWDT